MMDRVSFQLPPTHHQEWSIATLVPHIRLPLTQQNIGSQAEALEITMKLESSFIGEARFCISQLHTQITGLTLHIVEIRKEQTKGTHNEVWCIKCKSNRHYKDHCPTFRSYLMSGVLNPLPQLGQPWCEIFHKIH